MPPGNDESIIAATRLAALLRDESGAEILAEIQKLNGSRWAPRRETARPSPKDGPTIGVWDAERTPEGIAMRRRDGGPEWWRWADVAYVPPPAGARRVVLAGESVARGWLLEPGFTPAEALRRHLPHQVVDLARSNIDIATLREVVQRLPRIEPDLVVLFAGNNFTFAPLDDSYRDLLARALREGGYAQMRRAYVDSVVLPQMDALLEDVAALQRDRGIDVVIVVPQTNLRGWVPAAEFEVPALPGSELTSWYEFRREAMAARDHAQWAHVGDVGRRMSRVDGGLSPVSWYWQGMAAARMGDGPKARRLLEKARDATCGLLLDHVSGVITAVRQREIEFARHNGMRCVDVAAALGSADLPDLPDPDAFLDHIHLSDLGIERVMSRVADAVLGKPDSTTAPGPGADRTTRALGRSLAAGYCALRNQPDWAVRDQLRLALAADEQATTSFVSSYLDVLESPGIRWTHPAIDTLSANQQTQQVTFQIAQTRGHSPGYWTFRRVAQEMLGRTSAAPDRGWQRIDLLRLADGRGFRSPNFAPGKSYYQATIERSAFGLALEESSAGTLRLTYRLAAGSAAVLVNGIGVGELPASPRWSSVDLDVPAGRTREGINQVEIEWPVPQVDAETQVRADASALSRRTFPSVVPVFGALFTAFFDRGDPRPAPLAGRTDASTRWR